jgi:hypothetical protein
MEDAGGAAIPWELVIGELMWMTSAVAMWYSCSFYHAFVAPSESVLLWT